MSLELSVVIACYNMGDYVTEALTSVLSYPKQDEVEVIIVNDGSNDDNYTKGILDEYNYKNVTVIHQENKGLGNARNTGIEMAKATYVIPLDADNKIRHEYIIEGISILNSNPDVAIVYGDNKQFGLRDQDVAVGKFDITKLLKKNYIDACAVLRKTAWESINGYDENMPIMGYEDWDLNLRLFFNGWQFKYVNGVMYDYRVRENSMLINSNQNRELLLDYIFTKPELKQAKLLRDKILSNDEVQEELQKLQKRKVISSAIKIESVLKSILKLFNK